MVLLIESPSRKQNFPEVCGSRGVFRVGPSQINIRARFDSHRANAEGDACSRRARGLAPRSETRETRFSIPPAASRYYARARARMHTRRAFSRGNMILRTWRHAPRMPRSANGVKVATKTMTLLRVETRRSSRDSRPREASRERFSRPAIRTR